MMKKLISRWFDIRGYKIVSKGHYREIQDKIRNPEEQMGFFPLDYVNAARLLYFYNLFKLVENVPGDVVECGVGNGRSFLDLAYSIRVTGSSKNIWGFDSFEGFPPPTVEDTSTRNVREGQYAVDEKTVWKRLYVYLKDDLFIRQRVILIKGFFEDTLDNEKLEQISLLNLDVDLYQSYKVCLEKLYPKVSPGGIITFDEYLRESLALPGAMKAIDEFFSGRKDRFFRDKYYGKYYVVKS